MNYYTVSFNPFDEIRMAKAEGVFATVTDDWLRYNVNNWLLWTSCTAIDLRDYLFKTFPDGNFIILELPSQPGRGRMPSLVWDWLKKERNVKDPNKI